MMVTIITYDAYVFKQEDGITSQQTSRVKTESSYHLSFESVIVLK